MHWITHWLPEGGTWAAIGSECCIFIPEHNATLQEITDQLSNINKTTLPNPVIFGLSDWQYASIQCENHG